MFFDIWALVPGLTFVLYIAFAVFGLSQHRVNRIRWSFLLYMLAMTVWSFGSFMMRAHTPVGTPLAWNRIMVAGLLAVPITLFHALLDVTGSRRAYRNVLLAAGYIIWIYLLVLNFRGQIVAEAGYIGEDFYYRLGARAEVAYVLSYAYLIFAIINLVRELRSAQDRLTAKKLIPPLVGGVVLLIGVFANVDETWGRYPIDLFAAGVNGLLIFYSIYKYRLVHYSQTVVAIIVQFLLIVFAAFVFASILSLVPSAVRGVPFQQRYLLSLIVAVAAAVLFLPVRRGATATVQRLYFGKRLAYYRSLQSFSASLTAVMDLEALVETTVEKVQETFSLEWSCMLVLDYGQRNYRVLAQRGLSIPVHDGDAAWVGRDDPLIQMCSSGSGFVIPPEGTVSALVIPNGTVELRPQLLLPLRFRDRINGCLVLGRRSEKEYFDQLDLETLQIFSGQCSIALENAISFERLKRQQKRLQEMNDELAISNSKLEAFFDGITAPISLQDINYNVVLANTAAARLAGRAAGSMVGEKCYQVFFNRDKPCVGCFAQDSLHTQLPFAAEMRHEPSGTSFSLQYYPIAVPGGAKKLFLEFFQDITEQKRLREELIQSAKLAGIGTLASGIAHEINNPLAAIMATAEVILEQSDGVDTVKEYAEDILRCAQDAAAIIKDLNAYSRRDGAGYSSEANLSEAINAALKMGLRGLDRARLQVHANLGDVPPVVGNENELRQVVLNLIINAVQAMRGEGTLTITASADESLATVTVQDTGEGIPAEKLGEIFDPFYTTKPPGEGTGLGLSIVYQIVQKVRGRVAVESSVGKGTTVTVLLPLAHGDHGAIRFVQVRTQRDLEDVYFLQRKILVGEKGYREETIHRKADDHSFHVLAYRGLQPVGTVTCVVDTAVDRLPIFDHFPTARKLVGDTHAAEIDRLAVASEDRGGLVPLGLMMLAYMHAKARGAEVVFLDVFSDDKKQAHMYAKTGFVEVGTYYDPLAVTVMMLRQRLHYETDAKRLNHFLKPLVARLVRRLEFDPEEYESIMEQAKHILS